VHLELESVDINSLNMLQIAWASPQKRWKWPLCVYQNGFPIKKGLSRGLGPLICSLGLTMRLLAQIIWFQWTSFYMLVWQINVWKWNAI